VSGGPSSGSPRPDAGGRWSRLVPLLLVPVALLSDPAAGLPLRTYFFRDFTATFYPLRLFAAREIGAGRFPAWNPYIFEGSFVLPSLYPPDLLHVLWPGPVLVSWLLTLHLPLAAITAWWLARELGASREGAMASGALYALGGLALSSLNLYVFLQALALAPLVAGLLRRAAVVGGRATVVAGGALGLALSTTAVEFVGQALLLGLGLGLVALPTRLGASRLLGATLLGAGLAALPLALTFGLLPETARGAGFAADVRLGNAVHPAVLLQTLVPRLFGVPQAPAEAWWGGRFFSRGLPYFLSLYVGAVFLGLAATGLGAVRRRERVLLLGLGAAGLWYALGEWGGLAPLATHLPLAGSFRFPAKALLLPHAGMAIAAGFGLDRLGGAPQAWPRLAVAVGALAAVAVGVAGLLALAPPGIVAWSGVAPAYWPHIVAVVSADAGLAAAAAVAVAGLAVAVSRAWLRTGLASALLLALGVGDLARAGAGLNPQVPPSFFDLVPELRALELDRLRGGRVFSYGPDHSPAFRAYLQGGAPRLTLAGTWISRQLLAPYSNVIDRVETPEAKDLTSFVPRSPELETADYDPAAVDRLVPWLRQAAVSRIVTLDPLDHPDLGLLATAPAGPPGLAVRVYELDGPWPRAYVACRVVLVDGREAARLAPYRPGFAPGRDVALETGGPAGCATGRARRLAFGPGAERYAVAADGPAYLVTRDSFARGWEARVDGSPAPVLRANGKHRAVPVPAGRHEVDLVYAPPGARWGLIACLASVVAAAFAWVRAAPTRPS